MEDLQLEFPFTRNGALYAYNAKQLEYFHQLHTTLLTEQPSLVGKYTFNDFLSNNVSTYAPIFHKKFFASFIRDVAETQNDSVLDKWIDNKLHGEHPIYKDLDFLLNEGEVQEENDSIQKQSKQSLEFPWVGHL